MPWAGSGGGGVGLGYGCWVCVPPAFSGFGALFARGSALAAMKQRGAVIAVFLMGVFFSKVWLIVPICRVIRCIRNAIKPIRGA